MYCILFCFNVYVYICDPIYVFILIMNPGFNRCIICINLVLFLCFVRNDENNKLYVYDSVYFAWMGNLLGFYIQFPLSTSTDAFISRYLFKSHYIFSPFD